MIHVYVTQPGHKTTAQSYDVPSTVVIGRSSPCACRLEQDVLVSRCHAVLTVRPGKVTIRDLDSLNGLVINGIHYGGPSSRKMHHPYTLMDGDTVVVGETILSFSFAQARRDHSTNASNANKDAGNASTAKPSRRRSSPLRSATDIPGYIIESIVGTGGMGVVYQARDLATGRKVAIKTMHSDIAANKRALQHFLREIEVTKRISHPNIIGFLGSGITKSNLMYLVLEYADKGDLGRYLDARQRQQLDAATVHSFAMQIAAGLSYVHGMGIVHRDIKPKNILIAGERAPVLKISDLGLASHEDDANAPGTGTGGGTVAYMPPEQMSRFERVGPTGDVFSVGATMYEMLCGHRPYDFSRCDRLRAVSKGLIMPIARTGIPVHPGLAAIVDKCIAPRPEDRFAHCGELLTALQHVIL